MTVLDLRGPAGGDPSGLAALAAALHAAAETAERAATTARTLDVDDGYVADARDVASALRAAATAATDAAEQLRQVTRDDRLTDAHAAADAVEATLAEELRGPLGRLAGALAAR